MPAAAERSLDTGPQALGRRDLGDGANKPAEPLFPKGDLARKGGVAGYSSLGGAPLLGAEHAEHIFGRGQAHTLTVFFAGVAHRSRHALSLASPRLIQLFMVPSGTPARSARSS